MGTWRKELHLHDLTTRTTDQKQKSKTGRYRRLSHPALAQTPRENGAPRPCKSEAKPRIRKMGGPPVPECVVTSAGLKSCLRCHRVQSSDSQATSASSQETLP